MKQRDESKNQQQLAYTLVLTSPQLWHTTSVSLQLSTQKGIQNRVPAVATARKQHHPKVIHPIFVRITLSVYLLHIWHFDILPNWAMFIIVGYCGLPDWMMIGAGGGGATYPYPGCPYAGCPYGGCP